LLVEQSESKAFGNPDGSRADIDDIMRRFVDFGGSALWGGLATRADDLTARVIVGRKGSGKTVYLRRLQAYAAGQQDLVADAIQQDYPTTESVVRFCQWFEEPVLTEKWMDLWRTAILRSLSAHLLHNPLLSGSVSSASKTLLQEITRPHLRNIRTAASVYSQVRNSINSCPSGQAMTTYLNLATWDELENIVADILRQCPPFCLFIDAVDEEFAHAPLYWVRCQKGLFYRVMRFLRDAKLGGRFHVFICIRDIVLASVYRSEHSTRYRNEPHIRTLSWTSKAVSHFLKRKLEMLDGGFLFGNKDEPRTIQTWLGTECVRNGRGTDERLEEYIIRHTRLLPRDIVILGNMLSDEVVRAKKAGQSCVPRKALRRVVGVASAMFAEEELTICANHIASDQMPANASKHDYADVYTSTKEYIRGTIDQLKEFIRLIGRERFHKGDLQAAQELASEMFGGETDALSVLWQHGLLGCIKRVGRKRQAVYYDGDPLGRFGVPLDEDEYIFHPCLLHAVGLPLVGKAAIGPTT
jgi:hypothetical protein